MKFAMKEKERDEESICPDWKKTVSCTIGCGITNMIRMEEDSRNVFWRSHPHKEISGKIVCNVESVKNEVFIDFRGLFTGKDEVKSS